MESDRDTGTWMTAAEAGLMSCHGCRLVCRAPTGPAEGKKVPSPLPPIPEGRLVCPRCGASLHHRKPHSLSRTWALVIAALILYVPANLLPVTFTTSLGRTHGDTILSGVHYFMVSGDWPIALIIFIASIVVPFLKLIVLVYLLVSVHFRAVNNTVEKTRLYRLTEAVGRWSMLDIFVLTVLVSLVKMEALASIAAGPGMPFFAAVVVLTMLAAHCFDPRLIWDAHQENRHDHR
jgi:paraquat-inducible protein A